MPLLRAHTFGCKVNFCDTNALVGALLMAGFARAGDKHSADLEIVNTCAVTSRSAQKARRLIRKIRAAYPHVFLLVMGCAARIHDTGLLTMSEPDLVSIDQDKAAESVCRRFGLAFKGPVTSSLDPSRTRSFIKVQDGCDAWCTYCIVPYLRGREHSEPPSRVIDQVRGALDSGHREIVLSGIHLGRYGARAGNSSLVRLLEKVAQIGGDFRVRLSSIEPLELSDELLALMGSSEIFCQHLHVPLQSGSERILRAMGRPYSTQQFLERVEQIRTKLDNPALTTDIMAGFPGETDADHEATLALINEISPARAHVFVFSPRPMTPAAHMRPSVDGLTARRRSREIRNLVDKTANAFRHTLSGRILQVLPEKAVDGTLEGFCRRYQRVRFEGSNELLGQFVPIYIITGGEGADDVLQGLHEKNRKGGMI